MDTPKRVGRGFSGFIDRLRSGRLSATFALLAALSSGILLGSVLTGNVSGKEEQHIDSSNARPLTIPDPVTLSNGFSTIAKQVGPAVVNINTESCQDAVLADARNQRNPNQPDGERRNGGDNNDMQDFFNRFFGGGGHGGR